MNGWGTAKLGELVTLTGGAPFKSSDFCDHGIPVLKIKNVKANRLLLDDVDYIPEDVANEYSESFLRKGDLLITMTGNRMGGGMDSWVGKVALFNEERKYSLNQRIGIIRPKTPEAVHIRFLSFCLSTGDSQRELVQIATGSGGQANLSPKQILTVEVPHPPFPAQRAIASVLGALDDKIELNRRMNETLEALAQSLFKSWFVDATQAALPKGWREGKVSDVCTTQYGYTASATEEEVGPKFLRVMDINKQNWIEWSSVPHCSIPDEGKSRYALSVGDIVVARMADPGKSAIVEQPIDAVFASYLVRLKAKSLAHAYYLYYFLKSQAYTDYSEGAMSGSVQANMNAKIIVAAELPIPPASLMEAFLAKVLPLRQRIVANLNESRTLAALRDALLPKLLSGELRVPAAKLVEAQA